MIKNKNIVKTILIVLSLLFVLPSAVYIMKNGTVLNFDGSLEFKFFLSHNIDRLYQSIAYIVILLAFVFTYYIIIKNRNYLFKDIKDILKYITLISTLFIFVIPFCSSDIFYYLGIGRLASKYHQNPYYVDMKSYIDNNNINMENDTVMQKGYNNYWANTTVVYGAFWTAICSIISWLSLGNINFGLLLFKIINLIIHIGNCYLIYKISKKKVFTIAYGLNPFVLIEGIANVHNDIFVTFFMMLSIYEVYKKKNILFSIIPLALATDIKYFSVLLLPFIVLYHYREKDVKTRIIKCIEYGTIFVICAIIPYSLYIRDFNVFMGLIEQRERIAKGLYLFISEYFNNPDNLIEITKNSLLIIFSLLYIIACFMLLFAKKIRFYKNMRELYYFLLAFLFLLITNFQPWYFMWLVPFMIWQKSENIKLIVQMQIMTLIANTVFLIYSENFKYGVPFFAIFVFGTLICIIENKKTIIRRLTK